MKELVETAEKLGLNERMNKELQFLTPPFKRVDLEGIAEFENELQRLDQKTHLQVQSDWSLKLQEKPHLFDGPLANVIEWRVRKGVLEFRLQRSSFKIYDGLRSTMPLKLNLEQTPLYLKPCCPLSIGGVTTTIPDKDNPQGCIIFGIRSRFTVFGEGQATTLPAGYFNPDTDKILVGDPPTQRWLMSPQFTVIRELNEEVGNIQDYKSLQYLGFIYDGLLAKQPLIALRLGLDLTAKEVRNLLPNASEVKRYHLIPNDLASIRKFIARYHPDPHTVGKLVLHSAIP